MNKYRNNQGFTLIELLVAIAIMAIMMAFAAPSMIQWRDNAQIKEVARDVLGGLRQARSLAITDNQQITATIDPDGHQLSYGTITRELSGNVGLETSADDATWSTTVDGVTIFYPNGSCSAELYIRVNADDNLKVGINSKATGLARMD
ncbi:MAG: prepilin-type N-terminal cleavage/methylation domain-containing protein [Desulfuromonas sp.]|nr:prepilin-type N-terminal cleavage/methylation domain-containing protein [Desulfuromonas sp.]